MTAQSVCLYDKTQEWAVLTAAPLPALLRQNNITADLLLSGLLIIGLLLISPWGLAAS